GSIWIPSGNNIWFVLARTTHLALQLCWKKERVKVKRVTSFSSSVNKMKDMAIGQHLKIPCALFTGRLEMDSLKVGGSVSLEWALFQDDTSFGYARIPDDFDVRGSLFLSAS